MLNLSTRQLSTLPHDGCVCFVFLQTNRIRLLISLNAFCRSKGFDPEDPNTKYFYYGFAASVALAALFILYQGAYQEVTWKEFVANYLNKNVVSRSWVLYFRAIPGWRPCTWMVERVCTVVSIKPNWGRGGSALALVTTENGSETVHYVSFPFVCFRSKSLK